MNREYLHILSTGGTTLSPVTNCEESNSNTAEPVPSTSALVSSLDIRPYPKAGPRKGTTRGKKKGSTKILIDTPEKLAIENEWKVRQQKKQKNIFQVKANSMK